jgi:hypothetical protein
VGAEGSGLTPLPVEIPIDQVRAVPGRPPDPRLQFFKEGKLARFEMGEERVAPHVESVEQLRDRVAAWRAHEVSTFSSHAGQMPCEVAAPGEPAEIVRVHQAHTM